jgi:hypothetical protein
MFSRSSSSSSALSTSSQSQAPPLEEGTDYPWTNSAHSIHSIATPIPTHGPLLQKPKIWTEELLSDLPRFLDDTVQKVSYTAGTVRRSKRYRKFKGRQVASNTRAILQHQEIGWNARYRTAHDLWNVTNDILGITKGEDYSGESRKQSNPKLKKLFDQQSELHNMLVFCHRDQQHYLPETALSLNTLGPRRSPQWNLGILANCSAIGSHLDHTPASQIDDETTQILNSAILASNMQGSAASNSKAGDTAESTIGRAEGVDGTNNGNKHQAELQRGGLGFGGQSAVCYTGPGCRDLRE